MSAKAEQSALLGTSPNSARRSPPSTAATTTGEITASTTSLTQLAAERLGSLKWLMTSTSGGPLPSTPPSRSGILGSSNARASRFPVRRSASEDIDSDFLRRESSAPASATTVAAAAATGGGVVLPGRGRGGPDTNNATNFSLSRTPNGRPRSQGATMRRGGGSSKNTYRLSIDLERVPLGSAMWVKGRKSAVLEARLARSSSGQDSDGTGSARLQRGMTDASGGEIDGSDKSVGGGGGAQSDGSCKEIATGGVVLGVLFLTALVATWLFVRGGTVGIAAGAMLTILLLVVVFLLRFGRVCCFVVCEGLGDTREQEVEQGEPRGYHSIT